jgi:signal peptidase
VVTGLTWVGAVARAVAGAAATALAGLMFWATVPLAAGWHADVILSGSMYPHIAPGDLVIVARGGPAPRPGQVVEFTDPANPRRQLVHRIVARNADGTLTTRGDANRGPDTTPVPAADVHGLARLRIPWLGLPVYWLRAHVRPSPTSLLLLLGWLTAVLPYRYRTPAAPDPGGRHRRPDGLPPAPVLAAILARR